ncbi:MAG: hypothetical protein WBA39_04575 [Rivularia sp. (in: cyanobacteria)]
MGKGRWADGGMGRQGDKETRIWGYGEREQDAPTTNNLITLNF